MANRQNLRCAPYGVAARLWLIAGVLICIGLGTGQGHAELPIAESPAADPDTPEDFTFRRIIVKPPATTSQGQRRITVQIDPEEQARRLAAAPRMPTIITPGRPDAGAPPSSLDWFWEVVSPSIEDSAGRYIAAMDALSRPPGDNQMTFPRMQFLQGIAEKHGPQILRATLGTRVSPALVLAVIAVESAGRPDAVSSAGAQGLMQLIPATAERFGVQDAFDTAQNIGGGVKYLDWLMDRFDNDIVLVLAAYNAGEGAVARNAGVPPFAETRDYVPKVLSAWSVARGLCATVPELPNDGCVFKIGQAG